MQGFVSNRDSERNEDRADPLEIVLYAVFVATSARASVAELAEILQARLLRPISECLAKICYMPRFHPLRDARNERKSRAAWRWPVSRMVHAEGWRRMESLGVSWQDGHKRHGMRALQVELPKLQAAISIACRLGFATRLPNPYEGARPLRMILPFAAAAALPVSIACCMRTRRHAQRQLACQASCWRGV
jgi:hypothetical protein